MRPIGRKHKNGVAVLLEDGTEKVIYDVAKVILLDNRKGQVDFETGLLHVGIVGKFVALSVEDRAGLNDEEYVLRMDGSFAVWELDKGMVHLEPEKWQGMIGYDPAAVDKEIRDRVKGKDDESTGTDPYK